MNITELKTGWITLKLDKSNLPPTGSMGIYEFSDNFNNPKYVICPGQSSSLRSRVNGMVRVLNGKVMNSGKDVVFSFISKLTDTNIRIRYRVIEGDLTKSELETYEDQWIEYRIGNKDLQIKFNNLKLTYRMFMEKMFCKTVKETFGKDSNEMLIAEAGTDKGDVFKSFKWNNKKNELHKNTQLARIAYKNIYNKLLKNDYNEH